jgi:hypothetical protein
MSESTTPLEPTIAEDLLLLLFSPHDGVIHGEGRLFYPLGGAVLSQLALEERVEIDDAGAWKGATVRAVGEAPADPLLSDTWERLAAKPQKVHSLLASVGPQLREPVLDRLVHRGDLVTERKRWLGVFPHTVMKDGPTGRRATVLEPVRAVLVDGVEPAPRTAVLAALLSASGNLPALWRDIPWSGDVYTRGKELEKGDWGAQGVSRAVAVASAAVALTAVTSAAAIASTQ